MIVARIMSNWFVIAFIATDIILAVIIFFLEEKKIHIVEAFIHNYNHLLNFDNIRIFYYHTKIIDVFHYIFSYVIVIFFTALLVNALSISSQKSKFYFVA